MEGAEVSIRGERAALMPSAGIHSTAATFSRTLIISIRDLLDRAASTRGLLP